MTSFNLKDWFISNQDDNAPAAADVDAFAAVLKGDLGGAAAAAHGVTRAGSGNLQPPRTNAASASSGHSTKSVPIGSLSGPDGQQQLQWNPLPPEQQQELYQRQALHLSQQRIQQQQQQQQQEVHQQQQESPGSTMPSSGKSISFAALMPLLQPQLQSEQSQQLSVLYHKLKNGEIMREDFIKNARQITGDKVLIQTIRVMQTQRQHQVQKQQQQQPPSQPQPQTLPLQSQSSQPLQQVPQIALEPSASSHLLEASKHQQEQPQITRPPAQSPELSVISPSQQNLLPGQAPAHPFQQIREGSSQQNLRLGHPPDPSFQQPQLLSTSDHTTLPAGSQPESHVTSAASQFQSLSSALKKEEPHQDPEQGQQPIYKTGGPMQLQHLQPDTDKSVGALQSAKQHLPTGTLPPMQPRPPATIAQQSQITMPTTIGQPYAQIGLPQNLIPGQALGHPHLQLSQPVPQASGLPTLAQPQPIPPLQAQPEKPLTKYAKSKLRKEQKKREEEERVKKAQEEERLKKLNDEESLQKLQNPSTGMVIAAHQGSHSQPSTAILSPPPIDQLYNFHAVPMHAPPIDKDVPMGPGGLAGHGQSLASVKQEPFESQLEQNTVQNSSGLIQLSSEAAVSSGGQLHGSRKEQVLSLQGSMLLTSSTSALSLVQQVGIASMPASVMSSIPPAFSSGAQSTPPMTQVVAQQRTGSAPSAVPLMTTYNSVAPSAVISPPGLSTQPLSSVGATKTPTKKPAAGQKKSSETSSAQLPPSKKQKMSGGEPDQSIDQLNDVTAVSGVNLKEEEEQLLVGPKEESRTTEAVRKIVQEEEDKLFLEKGPLQAKVSAIATRCGLSIVNEDVGRCISMSVEERLRSMLYRLIKLSKQRCDVGKDGHRIVMTSDVRTHIFQLKRKAKGILDKKLAEENERLRKLNERKDKGSLLEVEREELKAKAQKAQQEEDDRVKAKAANVAARAAVGADDMLAKWVKMAEKGQQIRKGGGQIRQVGEPGAGAELSANRTSSTVGVSAAHSDKKQEHSDSTAAGPGLADNDPQGPSTAAAMGMPPGPAPGGGRMMSGRRRLTSKSTRCERAITTKDVLACLETEPQMSKSTLLFRLYERTRKISVGEKGTSGHRK